MMTRQKKSDIHEKERKGFAKNILNFSKDLGDFLEGSKDMFNAQQRRQLENYKTKTTEIWIMLNSGLSMRDWINSGLSQEEIEKREEGREMLKISRNIGDMQRKYILDKLYEIILDGEEKEWKKKSAEREVEYLLRTSGILRPKQLKQLTKFTWL